MKKLQYRVYVLYSLKDNNFYIGYTTNLHERLTSHISGNSQATKFRRPFALLFCEYFLSKHDATRREKYFKTTVGKKCLKLMLKNSLILAKDNSSG
jgi:putative endonuclease